MSDGFCSVLWSSTDSTATDRFVRVERWETPAAPEGANGVQGDLAESSEEELEDEMDDAESRMR